MTTGFDAPTVVFDGVCVLCCAGLRWIVRHDAQAHWRFLAMQSLKGAEALRSAGISTDAPTSFLVVYRGHFYQESDACLVIARDVGGICGILAVVGRVIPRAIRDWAYRLIARNRYRWFGRRQACYVPVDSERHRFLSD